MDDAKVFGYASVLVLAIFSAGCGDGQRSEFANKLSALTGGKTLNTGDSAEAAKLDLSKKRPEGAEPYNIRWVTAEAQIRTKRMGLWLNEYSLLMWGDRSDWLRKKLRRQDADEISNSAMQGDVVSQYLLGTMYIQGIWVDKDAIKAAKWFEKAADGGNANAQYELGTMLLRGEGGLSKDEGRAVAWLQASAEQGNASAQQTLGLLLLDGSHVSKDVPKAASLLQKAAAQGRTDAMMMLGFLFADGEGVPVDIAKAESLWTSAAEKGGDEYAYILGWIYAQGTTVASSSARAVQWWKLAAANGHSRAQQMLGMNYGNGEGVPQDSVLAHAWFNLAASDNKYEEAAASAVVNREIAERRMSSAEVAEAQRISSNWKVGQVLVRESGSAVGGRQPGSPGSLAKKSTGTAFIVNAAGNAITNHHVVEGCTEVRAEGRDGVVKVVTSDVVNDLAQLQIPGVPVAQATIARDPAKLRQGEDIVVFGFPLNAVLSSGGNLTPGVVSALTGLGNNTNQIQITAPIQPGSSGSAVINKKGDVVGVVAMKLSDSKMAKATGQVGQNVNFAVSGQTLKTFLDTHKVEYRSGGMFSLGSKSTADLADEARKWTLVVECWK